METRDQVCRVVIIITIQYGFTPLLAAADDIERSSSRMIKLCVDLGADVEAKDGSGRTARNILEQILQDPANAYLEPRIIEAISYLKRQ